MERPENEFRRPSPNEPDNEEQTAIPSESTWSSDAAAELIIPGEPIPDAEDVATFAHEPVVSGAGREEEQPEPQAEEHQPESPIDEEQPEHEIGSEPPIDEEVVDAPAAVSAELAAAVDEALAGPDGEVTPEEEEDDALLDWQPGEWFVVHTYAGYENKVKTNLESRIVSMNMEEKIYEVVIPTEDVMEVKSGKKQVVQKKVFPGYLLVRLDLDDDSWYVVRNTPGATGFVGSGTKPIPLSEKEVDRVLQRKGPEERPKPRLEFSAGDGVRVVTGPFANFQGVISDIDVDRSKLKVLVNIFGRETPVELGFDQVAKI